MARARGSAAGQATVAETWILYLDAHADINSSMAMVAPTLSPFDTVTKALAAESRWNNLCPSRPQGNLASCAETARTEWSDNSTPALAVTLYHALRASMLAESSRAT